MDRTVGEVAYTAYVERMGGISPITGDVLPNWDDLPPDIQKGWEYAAAEVIEWTRS